MRVAILANFPLHVISSLAGTTFPQGHYATWLPPLAQYWSKKDGIERYWITFSDIVKERTDTVFWNQTFIVLPTRNKGRASSLYREDRGAIAKTLRQLNPDIVHGWGSEDVYALAAVSSGFPAIISMQGILTHYVLHTRTDARTYFQALLESIVLFQTKVLTCESEWARPILQRRAPRAAITCIEYGVHPSFFETKWQPDSQRPVALFVGSLETRKGIQDVLEAFRSPRLAQFELWVAGSGSLEDRQGLPNVNWLGRLDRARLLEIMSKAWCLVLPTRADTSPNVVKEARVIGLPVLTTRHGGQSDYIQDGKNGFIIDAGDIDSLTKRLHTVLSDYAFCLERGRENWETDRAMFRVELTGDKFSKLYQELHQKIRGN